MPNMNLNILMNHLIFLLIQEHIGIHSILETFCKFENDFVINYLIIFLLLFNLSNYLLKLLFIKLFYFELFIY